MQLVKATDKLPEPYKWIPAKTWGGWSLVSYQKEQDHFFDYYNNVINKEDIEWLDESEHSFSIEDMRTTYLNGVEKGSEGRYASFSDYMKQEYKIDITK